MRKAVVVYSKGCFELTGFSIEEDKKMVIMYSYGNIAASIVAEEDTYFNYWKDKLTDAIENSKTLELRQYI